ncbi:hypothetical protein BDQ12DRAFT_727281 [Crucibulum laeve]|uniref:DUF6534 domain-containing protein n=1 Tax=Crucibulum laeve TaxID=68775 RepID=A0A5C3LPQ5_9AGAR|nr:hypothetical protein BDQ12DRAFT_727281 [Crucibulum laeve]
MSSMSQFEPYLGPLYIGSMFNYFLYGCLVIQLYDYWSVYFSTDRRFIQAMVYMIFVVETVQTVIMSHTVYTIMVVGYGNPQYLIQTPWSSGITPIFNGITAATVQLFFAWRIWVFKSTLLARTVAVVVAIMAVIQGAGGIAVSIEYFRINLQPERLQGLKNTITFWLSTSLACDIISASSMVSLLLQSKKETPFQTSQTLINALIANTVETGAITAVVAVVELILFLQYPASFSYVCMEYLLGRLFSNVLLATLNGRQRMRTISNREFSTVNSADVVEFRLHNLPTTGSGLHQRDECTTHPMHEQDVAFATQSEIEHEQDIKGENSNHEAKQTYGL